MGNERLPKLELKVNPSRVASLALVGLVMTWSPIFGTSEAVIFPWMHSYMDQVLISRIANLIGFAVVMMVLSAAGEQAHAQFRAKPLPIAGAVVGTVGMVVGAACGLGWLPFMLLPLGGVLRGVCWGILTVLWINTLMHVSGREAGASVVAALFVYAAYGIVIMLAGSVSSVLLVLLLAVCPGAACFGCLSVRQKMQVQEPVDQEGVEAPVKTRWALYVANFAFASMLGALLYFFAIYDVPVFVIAFMLMAAVVLLVYCFFWGDLDMHMTFRVFAMCFAVACFTVVVAGRMNRTLATCVVSATLVVILLYMVIIFADTQARFRRTFWRIPGMCQVFAALGMIVSPLAIYYGPLGNGIAPSALMVCEGACVIFIAALFSPTDGAKTRPWGFSSLIPEETQETQRVRRCGELSSQYKLTARELEILLRLVSGASKDEIAEALVISPATAKTHIRNIYGKLGVHSQHELMELVDEG